MAQPRKDPKGKILRKGENYNPQRNNYRYTYTDSFGTRHSLFAKTLSELREKEEQIQEDSRQGIDTYNAGKATINYLFERYMDLKTELKSSTVSNYMYMYNHFVSPNFGKRKIRDIKYSDVRTFYNHLLESDVGINTLCTINNILKPVFQLAVRDSIINSNPVDGVYVELKRNISKGAPTRHPLTEEQEQAFFNYLKSSGNDRWVPLFTVLFGTGCRIGEFIGLRWDDIDLENRSISINHNVTYYPRRENNFKNAYEVTTPKTAAGTRTIPMIDKVYDAFIAERSYQQTEGITCNINIDGYTNFIFLNRFNQIFNQNSVNRAIKRMVAKYNFDEELNALREKRKAIMLPPFSCHIIRHTFCSRLCENEVNIKVIQTVMGHKDIQTTLDIYSEISEAKKQKVFSELNDVL